MNVLPQKGGYFMTIETNITNHRELASALAQYMNTRAVYLGPPTFACSFNRIVFCRLA